jgi:hypothetical protein
MDKPIETKWKSLYKVGGICAWLAILTGILEIAISFLPGSGQIGAEAATVGDWFALFQNNWFIGLRNLGLINIFLVLFGIPLFLALYAAHRQSNPAGAALATIISYLGAGIFFATNRAFAMWSLSSQYAAAATEVQKTIILAAGQAMLTVGQSHTAGTYLAFSLAEIANILIGIVMVRGRVFSKATAIIGIVAFVIMLAYETCSSFVPVLRTPAMYLSTVGGLLSLTWYLLVARRLFQLAN